MKLSEEISMMIPIVPFAPKTGEFENSKTGDFILIGIGLVKMMIEKIREFYKLQKELRQRIDEAFRPILEELDEKYLEPHEEKLGFTAGMVVLEISMSLDNRLYIKFGDFSINKTGYISFPLEDLEHLDKLESYKITRGYYNVD